MQLPHKLSNTTCLSKMVFSLLISFIKIIIIIIETNKILWGFVVL